jgi:hypothetical protein
MTGSIETITDRNRFADIFNTMIAQTEVHLRTSSGNLRIRFLGYSEGMAAFKIPYIKTMPDSALVFSRIKEVTVYLELKTIEKQEDNVFIFSPVKIQLIHSARTEDRVTPSDSQKTLLFITNLISDFLCYDGVKREKRKIEFIRDKVLEDLKKMFAVVKVQFIAEESGDPRMRFFYETVNQPIFIADITKKPEAAEEARFAFYREFIYAKEQFNMKRKGLISEIAMPVLYRKKIPYGYLQVNNTVPISDSYLQILARASELASQMVAKTSAFSDMCGERLLVSDLSKKGIGIVFRDRKFIRFFKEKNIVAFDLSLPGTAALSISCIVRNITLLENKIIKVGCEIREMSEDNRAAFEQYVASHAPSKPEKAPEHSAGKSTQKVETPVNTDVSKPDDNGAIGSGASSGESSPSDKKPDMI